MEFGERRYNVFAQVFKGPSFSAGAPNQHIIIGRQHMFIQCQAGGFFQAAADAVKWDTRPSPKPGNAKTGVVTGRGISCCLYEGNNGYCALVAEVSVDQDTGVITVTRFAASQDSGTVSNPNGLMNQMEGGALQGMSRALFEEVTWDQGGLLVRDWRRYPVYQTGRMPVPQVISVPINRPGRQQMGAGECVITCVASAIANAVFDATGARLRQVPFTPDRVLAALASRG